MPSKLHRSTNAEVAKAYALQETDVAYRVGDITGGQRTVNAVNETIDALQKGMDEANKNYPSNAQHTWVSVEAYETDKDHGLAKMRVKETQANKEVDDYNKKALANAKILKATALPGSEVIVLEKGKTQYSKLWGEIATHNLTMDATPNLKGIITDSFTFNRTMGTGNAVLPAEHDRWGIELEGARTALHAWAKDPKNDAHVPLIDGKLYREHLQNSERTAELVASIADYVIDTGHHKKLGIKLTPCRDPNFSPAQNNAINEDFMGYVFKSVYARLADQGQNVHATSNLVFLLPGGKNAQGEEIWIERPFKGLSHEKSPSLTVEANQKKGLGVTTTPHPALEHGHTLAAVGVVMDDASLAPNYRQKDMNPSKKITLS